MLKDYEIKDRALDHSLTLMLPDGAPVLPLLREKVEDGLEHALGTDSINKKFYRKSSNLKRIPIPV